MCRGSSLLLPRGMSEHRGKKSQRQTERPLMAYSSHACHCRLANAFHFLTCIPRHRAWQPFSLLCSGNASTYYQKEVFGRADLGKGYSHIQLRGLFTPRPFISEIRAETTTIDREAKFPTFPNVT